MQLRHLILAGMLALPAWVQADETPAPTARPSFDFHGDALRKVVRNTAASQYGSYDVPVEQSPARKPKDRTQVVWQPPEPARVTETPRPHHPPPYPVSHEQPDYSLPAMTCRSRDNQMGGQQGVLACEVDETGGKSFGEGLRDDLIDDLVSGLVGGLFNSLFSKP